MDIGGMEIGDFIYQHLDFLWLPVAYFVVPKNHRWRAMAFILACALTLRAQVAIMATTGHPTGMLTLMHSYAYSRGLVIYGIVIMLFLILSYFSRATMGIVYFAASISIYLITFCFSMLMMLL